MPFYDWRCPKCNEIKETMSTIADKKSPICEKCNIEMTQVLSKPNIMPGALRSGNIA